MNIITKSEITPLRNFLNDVYYNKIQKPGRKGHGIK